jgi:hypothetical protein
MILILTPALLDIDGTPNRGAGGFEIAGRALFVRKKNRTSSVALTQALPSRDLAHYLSMLCYFRRGYESFSSPIDRWQFNLGYAMAAKGYPWTKTPPDFDEPETLPVHREAAR